MLRTLFKAAMKQKLIRSNSAVGLELPKVVKAKIEPSTMKDVRAILDQAPADVGFCSSSTHVQDCAAAKS